MELFGRRLIGWEAIIDHEFDDTLSSFGAGVRSLATVVWSVQVSFEAILSVRVDELMAGF